MGMFSTWAGIFMRATWKAIIKTLIITCQLFIYIFTTLHEIGTKAMEGAPGTPQHNDEVAIEEVPRNDITINKPDEVESISTITFFESTSVEITTKGVTNDKIPIREPFCHEEAKFDASSVDDATSDTSDTSFHSTTGGATTDEISFSEPLTDEVTTIDVPDGTNDTTPDASFENEVEEVEPNKISIEGPLTSEDTTHTIATFENTKDVVTTDGVATKEFNEPVPEEVASMVVETNESSQNAKKEATPEQMITNEYLNNELLTKTLAPNNAPNNESAILNVTEYDLVINVRLGDGVPTYEVATFDRASEAIATFKSTFHEITPEGVLPNEISSHEPVNEEVATYDGTTDPITINEISNHKPSTEEVANETTTDTITTVESTINEVTSEELDTNDESPLEATWLDLVTQVIDVKNENAIYEYSTDEISNTGSTPDEVSTTKVTSDNVPDDLKKFVDKAITELLNDKFSAFYIFENFFSEDIRLWILKYAVETYKLRTDVVYKNDCELVRILKMDFSRLQFPLNFDDAVAVTLKVCFAQFHRNPTCNLAYHGMDMLEFGKMLDYAGTLFAKPKLCKLMVNPETIGWRQQLTIWRHRLEIMQNIVTHQVSIISGGPGVGKSTQIPQYVLEYMASCGTRSNVICVHPYRVVAMTLAKRIAFERGDNVGYNSGYFVRNRSDYNCDTDIKFCTSEILLRSMSTPEKEFLTNVTHIIIDSIDIRDKHTDFLLMCLRECLVNYPNMRLVLISGSNDNSLFVEYFKNAPVVHIPSLNVNKAVVNYYLNDCYMIAKREPRQMEKLRILPNAKPTSLNDQSIDLIVIKDIIHKICVSKLRGGILVYLPSFEDIRDLQDIIMRDINFIGIDYDIFFLHRMLDISSQTSIFSDNSSRKIILGTAIAESSFYIEDVNYIIDTGREWQAGFVAGNKLTHVTTQWISKESADRRVDRMGKSQAGPLMCYRLYTKKEYNAMRSVMEAEMRKTTITDLCLLARKLAPENTPLKKYFRLCPEPPSINALKRSVVYLTGINALKENEKLTPWGNIMGHLNLEPRLTKILMHGLAFRCIEPVVTIVAFMCMRGPSALPALPEDLPFLANRLRQFSHEQCSDHLCLIELYKGWHDLETPDQRRRFCVVNFLRAGMMELVTLKRFEILKQLHQCGYLEKEPLCSPTEHNENGNSWSTIRACLTAGLAPQFGLVNRDEGFISIKSEDHLKVGNESVAYLRLKILPLPWIIYEAGTHENNLKTITPVTPLTLLFFATNCLAESQISKDKDKKEPFEVTDILMNEWVQFTDNGLLGIIVRIRQLIEDHMLHYITIPHVFKGSYIPTIFDFVMRALQHEDVRGEMQMQSSLFKADKPRKTRMRLNYSKQPFTLPKCNKVDSPDLFKFLPILTEYKPYSVPHEPDDIVIDSDEMDRLDALKRIDIVIMDDSPRT